MSAPDHITEFVCEDCGDHVHVFGHYYGLPVHSASSANIRHARAHHQGAFARRHLVGSPNAKRPQPTMLSSQRGPTEDEDGRWTTRPDAIASRMLQAAGCKNTMPRAQLFEITRAICDAGFCRLLLFATELANHGSFCRAEDRWSRSAMPRSTSLSCPRQTRAEE
jgi:hypothetical protein